MWPVVFGGVVVGRCCLYLIAGHVSQLLGSHDGGWTSMCVGEFTFISTPIFSSLFASVNFRADASIAGHYLTNVVLFLSLQDGLDDSPDLLGGEQNKVRALKKSITRKRTRAFLFFDLSFTFCWQFLRQTLPPFAFVSYLLIIQFYFVLFSAIYCCCAKLVWFMHTWKYKLESVCPIWKQSSIL